jgi:hypothetical protein
MKKILFIVFTMMMAASVYSQTGYKTISGRIFDEYGISTGHYYMSLLTIGGNPVFVVKPNAFDGTYEFRIPDDYKGELYLYLGVVGYKYQKRKISFPIKENLKFNLHLIPDTKDPFITNLWKDPDNIPEVVN